MIVAERILTNQAAAVSPIDRLRHRVLLERRHLLEENIDRDTRELALVNAALREKGMG